MMERAARRYRDSRFRSPPPRRRIRDGEYEEDRRLHARGVSGSVTSESERFRGIGYRHDGYRDEHLQRLSQFNESLLPRDSPSLKFQWNRLLVEKPSYTNANGGPSFGLNNGPADERGYPETSRYADSGAISMENQMSLTISTYPKDMAASKCYGGIDSSSKKEDIQYQDYSGFDNIHTIHREEEKSRVGLSEAPLYARPITGPNFYSTSEMVMPPTQRIGLDDNDRTQIVNSPRNSELRLRDLTDQMPVQPSPVDDIDGLFMYPEVRQGERSDVGTLPNDAFCKKKESILEGYTHLNSLRHTTVDGMDDIDVSLDDMREQHDCLHSSQKHYLGECIASRSIEHDEEVMGSRSSHLE